MVCKLWWLLLSPHYSLQYICVTFKANAIIPNFTQIEIAKQEAKQKVSIYLNAGHVFKKITLFENLRSSQAAFEY